MAHDHSGDAAAGMTAGMMLAILGVIAAAVIVFAVLVWTPWSDGGTTTNIDNNTNNPVPSQSQPNNSGGNSSGGSSNNSGGGSNSGGSSSGGSSSGSSGTNTR